MPGAATPGAAGIDHVVEADLSPPSKACSICGYEGERPQQILLQRDPDVFMRACPRCCASSAERMPLPEALAALYAPSVYTPRLSADTSISERLAAHIVSHLPLDPAKDVRILDYGGNDGSLARTLIRVLAERGHRGRVSATVVDLFPREPEEGLRFQHVDDFARSTDRYDLLMASAVLEHLPDLGAVTRRIAGAAEPGALFWGRTPYDVPLARLGVGFPVLWPRHLHDLGPAFWARFLETFGLRGRLLRSTVSPVESSLSASPARTLAAWLMKIPARLERAALSRAPDSPKLAWRWVGGWEALVRLDGPRDRP